MNYTRAITAGDANHSHALDKTVDGAPAATTSWSELLLGLHNDWLEQNRAHGRGRLTAFGFKPLRGTALHLSRGHRRLVELVCATWKRH